MKHRAMLSILLLTAAVALSSCAAPSPSASQSATPSQPPAVSQPADMSQSASSQPSPPASSSTPDEEQEQLAKAPDFVVYDANGAQVRLSDYVGTPVVLNFWASWCGPCKREMPDFNEKYLELGDKVQFLMINLTDGTSETVESASALIAAEGYSFPVLFDTQSYAASVYGVVSIPTTYFIDAQGHAIAKAVGAIDAETLQRGIDMILPAQD